MKARLVSTLRAYKLISWRFPRFARFKSSTCYCLTCAAYVEEYRLREVIQDACKFMRHSKRAGGGLHSCCIQQTHSARKRLVLRLNHQPLVLKCDLLVSQNFALWKFVLCTATSRAEHRGRQLLAEAAQRRAPVRLSRGRWAHLIQGGAVYKLTAPDP
jgi:hypothetical protein